MNAEFIISLVGTVSKGETRDGSIGGRKSVESLL